MSGAAVRPSKKTSLGRHAESSSHAENAPVATASDSTFAIRKRLLDTAADLLPGERISECMRHASPMAAYVACVHNPDEKSGHFSNLKLCDSPSCPMCAYRRAEEDRSKLDVAIAAAQKEGLFPVLVTLTLRHDRLHTLDELREALRVAFDRTFSGAWYADLVAEYGIAGKVKSWEVTYGQSGWHPHLHTLVFMEMELAGKWLDEFSDAIKERWQTSLRALGYDASLEYGADIRTAKSDIADYIAKFGREPLDREWGVSHEVAKSPVKKAHRDGMTPFQLLAAAGGDSDQLERLRTVCGRKADHAQAGALYREYFLSFKGKPRLYWGSLLKKLNLKEVWKQHAEKMAVENPDNSYTIAMIELGNDGWRGLWRSGLVCELKALINRGDAIDLALWIEEHGIRARVTDEAWHRSGAPPPSMVAF